MKRKRALMLLARSKMELAARFGVTKLALFGSTVRDAAISGSDVDILVAFDGTTTSKRQFEQFCALKRGQGELTGE